MEILEIMNLNDALFEFTPKHAYVHFVNADSVCVFRVACTSISFGFTFLTSFSLINL